MQFLKKKKKKDRKSFELLTIDQKWFLETRACVCKRSFPVIGIRKVGCEFYTRKILIQSVESADGGFIGDGLQTPCHQVCVCVCNFET